MNTPKKQFQAFFFKKGTIIFIGTIVTILLLFVINSSTNFSNDNGKSNSVVQASRPIETDFTKILLPYAETTSIENGIEKILTIDGNMAYYRFLSPSSEEKFSFAVGYMEGCPDGCDLDNKNCPEACFNPYNWKEEKRFVMDEKYILKNFSMSKDYHTGIFIKLDDPSYASKNAQAACIVDKYPLQLTDCIGYKDSDETKINFRFSDFEYRNSMVIVLP